MKNALVAKILYEIADLLDLDGVAFKPRAYRRAAEVVESLSEPIEDLVASGAHAELPGVGEAIAKKIAEIVETGRLAYHDELRAKLPIDLYALTQVDGVGPKTAKLLYDELGVKTLDDLERAARDGQIRSVKGLGEKTEAKILRGLVETRGVEGRILLGVALPLAERLIEALRETRLFQRLEYAGSLRRGRETIGDLDLLAVSDDPAAAAAAFVGLSDVAEVLAHGESKASVRLHSGLQVDLRIVPNESFGAALQYFTGSKAHNIALRKLAVAKGWKLNEYGLYDSTDRTLAGEDEDGIYRALGLEPISPELREDAGEIELAARASTGAGSASVPSGEPGSLPKLIEFSALRGDLHVHTDASDGTASPEEMVAAAQARGLEYIAITDHARFAEVIGGHTPETLLAQIDEIAKLNKRLKGFRVLTGIEVNIQPDGSLDMPDEILAKLDWVVASVHSHFHQTKKEMTARLVRAIENEHVDCLAHPTGRKIGERPAYDADWDIVFRTAAEHACALEINANPIRLDLNAELARRAVASGCRLAIGSDAHAPEHFDFLRLGVLTARRGWATAANVSNTSETQR
ncbi:MAG: DNA polymerase/3'-5' exonuclease PolX [Candidatus Bipolaricaulota bacterium]|nr:DNA polymerase/3'-5' exonuclease PolX [Candidatus Bipolaricaulota bacterium]